VPQLNVRISHSLDDALRTHSRETGVPIARIVRRLIEEFLGTESGAGTPAASEQREEKAYLHEPKTWHAASAMGMTKAEFEQLTGEQQEREQQQPASEPQQNGSAPGYKCPLCKHRASSPAAICPVHGRRVVAA
jgi:Ribbon-helix-helix domain